MQTQPVALPSSPAARSPHCPGMTPARVTAGIAPPAIHAVALAGVGWPAVGAAVPPAQVQHKAMEFLEDAFLLLLLVFAVPAVMLLLALPFALVFRLVAATSAQ